MRQEIESNFLIRLTKFSGSLLALDYSCPEGRKFRDRHASCRKSDESIHKSRDDITRFLHTRLIEDMDPDAMDSSLEADILKKITDDISEMQVEVMSLGKLPRVIR